MAKREENELPVLPFESEAAWERWLRKHHASARGVWIKFAKKNSGVPSVTYAQALDVALCHGWIDGQANPYDAAFYLQRFTPRRPKSKWSKINCGHVARLIAAGRMQPAGLKQIEAAKADGRWDAAYDSSRTATVPDDLRTALEANPRASANFETLNRQNRYAILYRIQDAKRPETRAKRIAGFIAMLEKGEKIHP